MPPGRPDGIDEQAILFGGPQAQASPDGLIEQHFAFGRSGQHDTVDTRLIKAFGENRTGDQGMQMPRTDLAVARLALFYRRTAHNRGRSQPGSPKGML